MGSIWIAINSVRFVKKIIVQFFFEFQNFQDFPAIVISFLSLDISFSQLVDLSDSINVVFVALSCVRERRGREIKRKRMEEKRRTGVR